MQTLMSFKASKLEAKIDGSSLCFLVEKLKLREAAFSLSLSLGGFCLRL